MPSSLLGSDEHEHFYSLFLSLQVVLDTVVTKYELKFDNQGFTEMLKRNQHRDFHSMPIRKDEVYII